MSSIERTAYPRFSTGRIIKKHELDQFYSLTPDELCYINEHICGDALRLNFSVLLKVFQRLGYFPELKSIPDAITTHIKKCLGLFDDTIALQYDHKKTKYRHCDRICKYLKITRWKKNKSSIEDKPIHPARHLAIQFAYQAAETMNHPADIINVVIEELIHHRYELPSFSTLNSLVKHTRALVNRNIFKTIYDHLSTDFIEKIDDLFVLKPGFNKTGYHALKRLPKSPTLTHFKELQTHHDWLMSFEGINDLIENISKVKLQQFAVEAKSLDASDFKHMNTARRYALVIFLIHQAQRRAKDSLAIMYTKTLSKMHKKSNNKLLELREQSEEKTQHLLVAFSDVLSVCKEKPSYEDLGKGVEKVMSNHGGVDFLHDECDEISALYSDSYLAFLWSYFSSSRPTLFKLVRILNLQTASQNQNILTALNVVLRNFSNRNKYLTEDIDISFAPEKWKNSFRKKQAMALESIGVTWKWQCLLV